MESDLFEIFNIQKQDLIRDIHNLLVDVCSQDELDKIIISLEKSRPKIKINNRITKKTKGVCKNKSDVFTKSEKEIVGKVEDDNQNSSQSVQCWAYIQSGRRCSRKVRNSNKNYCGLHNVLHYGDIKTGYLIKNTI
jgi:hypothetical protein